MREGRTEAYLFRTAEQRAECEAAAREALPAVLPLFKVLALHLRLLLRKFDWDVRALVRLDDGAHVRRLEDRDRYRTVSCLAKGRRV